MNIHQISMTYVNEQDRLLLRVNTQTGEELRLWLTRRLTLGVLPALKTHAGEQLKRFVSPAGDKPAAPLEERRQQMLDAFQREAAAYAADYKTPYKEPDTQTAEAAPLLVTEVVIALQANGQLQLKLSEKLKGVDRHVDLALPAQLAQGVVHNLQQAAQQAGWLDVPQPPAPEAPADPLALLAGGGNTGYLN